MKKLLLLSLLLLSACSKQNVDPRTIHGVDSKLATYRDNYIAYKGSPLAYDIPMQFVAQVFPIVGMCTRWSNGYRQIEIDPVYWASQDEGQRLQLVFHELGHCDLNRGHISEVRDNGFPVSFMNPYTFWYSPLDLSYYINELLTDSSTNPTTGSNSDCVKDIEVK